MYVNLPYPIKTMTAPKIPPTTFRFQPQVKTALMFISDRDGRSMANMLEWLIKQHCEREGLGWPPKGLDGQVESKPTPKARAARVKNTERK